MPFACAADAHGVHVKPATAISYRIIDRRTEQPFTECGADARCRTLMIHRFTIACAGKNVAWARVAAAAATEAGVPLPKGLPVGFAPVSTMSGRFVLPAVGTQVSAPAKVSRQSLSPDSVIARADDDDAQSIGGWQTEVRAVAISSAIAPAAGTTAMRVAASLAAVMAVLFAASMIAAGRLRLPVFAVGSMRNLRFQSPFRFADRFTATFEDICERARNWQDWETSSSNAVREETLNALSTAEARLLHVELKVASLDYGLLLRDVLAREVATVRSRLSDLDETLHSITAPKAASMIRNILRDLERINRIAESAVQDTNTSEVRNEAAAMPQSEAEAFRILGINPDASAIAAKKLVDALRMSWHPDFARDETDREHREERMKQINAAWDLIKPNYRAAA